MRKQNYSLFFMCSVAAPYVCGIESAALTPDATLPRRIISKEDWIPYFEKTRYIKEPRQSLKIALDKYWFDAPGVAVDLGAGAGRDTLYLLNKGWSVLAIDSQQRAIDIIHERIQGKEATKLKTDVVNFGEMKLPSKVDLMNASYSLPFCSPDEFFLGWKKITRHLNSGGLFVGQFFGLRDAWTWDSTMTFLSHQQVMDLFKNQFEFLYFSQEEGFSMTSDGESVTYRHCYHVIAKKV